MSILFLNILTLLAPSQSVDNLFHSLTILCENEKCIMSSLHCFFTNVTPCPLIFLSSLAVKQIFLAIFSYHSIFKKLQVESTRDAGGVSLHCRVVECERLKQS